MDEEEKEIKLKKPENTSFKQQRLPAWQPLLTPTWVIGTFAVVGILFLVIGGLVLSASNAVVEIRTRYDECAINTTCTKTIAITKTMSRPIYAYYELTNFYQNHRRYVKSRSDAQLRGSALEGLSECEPIESNAAGRPYYPCGLIAFSYFNDSFSMTRIGTGVPLSGNNWQRDGIAWPTDKEDKFKRAPGYNPGISAPPFTTVVGENGQTLPDPINEDFIVWMRTAGLPTFRKLYRKIEDSDLNEGESYTLSITNQYDVSKFDGEKAFVLSTTSWLGGKNTFLAVAYLVVGGLCIIMCGVFMLRMKMSPRTLGDMSYFDWSGAGPKGDDE